MALWPSSDIVTFDTWLTISDIPDAFLGNSIFTASSLSPYRHAFEISSTYNICSRDATIPIILLIVSWIANGAYRLLGSISRYFCCFSWRRQPRDLNKSGTSYLTDSFIHNLHVYGMKLIHCWRRTTYQILCRTRPVYSGAIAAGHSLFLQASSKQRLRRGSNVPDLDAFEANLSFSVVAVSAGVI